VDGQIEFIDLDTGRFHDSRTAGRSEVASFYQSAFEKAAAIDSENFVDFAHFVLPDLLVIHGRFRPDLGEPDLPFVQIRIRDNDQWRIKKLSLFLSSKSQKETR
jgi:hypothetical protein